MTDKIIFEVLARHGAVSLPGTGVLRVERVAARREGAKLIPPRNTVRFSSEERKDSQSVITLLEKHTGNAESAGELYREWFEGARTAKGVRIEGVGELAGNTFTLSPELEKALNPHISVNERKVRVKRRGGRHRAGVALSILAVVLIAGGAWWYFGHESLGWPLLPWETGRQNSMLVAGAEKPAILDVIVADDLPSEADSLPAATFPDTATADETALPAAEDTARTAIHAQPVPEAAAIPDGTAGAVSPAGPVATTSATAPAGSSAPALYHVVGGVFSVDANADKYIDGMKRKFPSLDISYGKVPFKGGKVMVSLYSSADRQQADNRLTEFSRATSNPDLWVYKSN